MTRAGLTLSAAVLAIVAVAAVPVFRLSQERFSSPETQAAMKAEGQRAVDLMADRLSGSRRLFFNNPVGRAFLACVSPSSAGPIMAGSLLPTPNDKSGAAGFQTECVGNILFFAETDGAEVPTYRFESFYLSIDATKKIAGVDRRELWNWKSAPYADADALSALPARARNDAIAVLLSSGIARAWSPAATNAPKAFYTLSAAGMTPDPAHRIPEASARRLISITSGMTHGGYRVGVSPNSGGKFVTPYPVPKYATPSGDFPSGFEVVVAGPSNARQVFMRLVLAAQGRFSGKISSEQVTLVTVRDLW